MEQQHPINKFDAKPVILVLSGHDRDKIRYEGAPGLFSDEVSILELPLIYDDNLHPALKNIYSSNLAKGGVILIQSPFDKFVYYDSLNAPYTIALAKNMYMSRFLQHLGVKKFTVDHITLKNINGAMKLKASGKTPWFGGKGKFDLEKVNKFREQLTLEDVFLGGDPNIDAAERLLLEHNLMSDSTMKSILELCKDRNNKLLSRSIKINLSSEAQYNMKIAGEIKIPTYLTSISGEFKKVCEERNEVIVTVKIEF